MDYYAERLSGERLRQCYDIAPPRVRQCLDAEIAHVLGRIGRGDTVLELGCGSTRRFEVITPRGPGKRRNQRIPARRGPRVS